MDMISMKSVLLLLLTISVSNAQDTSITTPPSSVPTAVEGSTRRTPTRPSLVFQSPKRLLATPSTANTEATTSTKPSNVPLFTSSPTLSPCANNPRWGYPVIDHSQCTPIRITLTCDHDLIRCGYLGVTYGYASTNCCKCKPDCDGQCNEPIHLPVAPCDVDDNAGGRYPDDDYEGPGASGGTVILPSTEIAIGVFALACCGISLCRYNNSQAQRNVRRNRHATQQTMMARRRQQRENNTTSQGLTEEERNHARYELFVTNFLFQTVLPDKSNVAAKSLRSSASKLDEEHPHTAEKADDASNVAKQDTLSDRLASWRRPSAKDECCICLECYSAGETICAPISTECDHVFHEGCINEWLKKNDKCPLCRVQLLKDSTT